MLLKWHLNVYWYTIAFMTAFLIFLMVPNSLDTSNGGKSYDQKLSSLADQSSRATSATERASVARQLSNLERGKDQRAYNPTLNLIPLRVFLMMVMISFLLLIFRILWQRKKYRAAIRRA